jgi:hypothetical protein
MPMRKWLSELFAGRSHHEDDPLPPAIDLDIALKDAEELLGYVAEAGIDIASADVQTIASAITAGRTAGATAWTSDTAAPLVAAIARVAAKASPVTAETLRASRYVGPKTMRTYEVVGFALLIVIITLSYLSFVTNGLSKSISANIETANNVVVTLRADFATSPRPKGAPVAPVASISLVEALRDFVATAGSIKRDTVSLNGYLFFGRRKIEWPNYVLPNDLQNSAALPREVQRSTKFYQDVQRVAKDVLGDTNLYYGALSNVILTILYALLGAIAYLLRLFSAEVSKHTFSLTYSASARILVAMIAGLIIGLFNAFTISTGASLSPLALAFLAGYAADGFFASLEGLSFKKPA